MLASTLRAAATAAARRFSATTSPVAALAIRAYSSADSVATKAHDQESGITSNDFNYYQHKKVAMTGPRFEQVDLTQQPNPTPAIDLIAQEPVRMVNQRIVACDGGGGPLGHPKVYINLDQEGAHKCLYCGVRFEQEHGHHH